MKSDFVRAYGPMCQWADFLCYAGYIWELARTPSNPIPRCLILFTPIYLVFWA